MTLVRFKARNHPQQQTQSDVDDRATTPEMFSELHHRFRFTLDAAAAPHNAKLDRYYTVEQDGLRQPWTGERVFVNPPYSDIRPWVEKAWTEINAEHWWVNMPDGTLFTDGVPFRFCNKCDREEWADGFVRPGEYQHGDGAELVVMLLPANRTEQGWWQDHVEPALRRRDEHFRCEFLPGRLRFLAPGQSRIGPNERPPFGCCLLIWGDAT